MSRLWLRTLFKGIFIAILILAAVFMVALWGVGRFLPYLAEHTFDDLTQFKLKIHSNHTQLWKGRIAFENVVVTNPSSFKEPKLALFQELNITVPLSLQLLTFDDISDLTVDEISVYLRDIYWIINSDGSVNWVLLGHQLHEAFSDGTKIPAPSNSHKHFLLGIVKPPHISRPIPFIHTLSVRLGTLHYISYLNPSAPETKMITINYERTFQNVEDINAVFAAITMDLIKFQLSELAQNLFKEFVHPEQLDQAIQKGSEKLKSIDKESIKDTSRAAKDIFKSFSQ